MRDMPSEIKNQIANSYKQVVDVMRVANRLSTTDLTALADQWWKEEDARQFHIGCPNHGDRPALILMIEAARQVCGLDIPTARRLLYAALAHLAISNTVTMDEALRDK